MYPQHIPEEKVEQDIIEVLRTLQVLEISVSTLPEDDGATFDALCALSGVQQTLENVRQMLTPKLSVS